MHTRRFTGLLAATALTAACSGGASREDAGLDAAPPAEDGPRRTDAAAPDAGAADFGSRDDGASADARLSESAEYGWFEVWAWYYMQTGQKLCSPDAELAQVAGAFCVGAGYARGSFKDKVGACSKGDGSVNSVYSLVVCSRP